MRPHAEPQEYQTVSQTFLLLSLSYVYLWDYESSWHFNILIFLVKGFLYCCVLNVTMMLWYVYAIFKKNGCDFI